MKYIPSNITPEIYFSCFCEDENAKRFFEEYVEKTSNNVDDIIELELEKEELEDRIIELENGLYELKELNDSLLDDIKKFK